MAVIFKTYNIPNTSRRKYGDYPSDSNIVSSSKGGGSGSGGGVGTTEYMTAFQTDVASGSSWLVSGITSLNMLSDGVSIKVRFNSDSDSGASANTIDFGIGAEGESGETFPHPIYLKSGKLVTDEILEGDELMLTYRENVSGWTIDASNERFMREVWHKLNSGTVISQYNVASSGDVIAYGTDGYSGYTELSVIDNLTNDDEPHGKYALSAYQGKVLSGMVNSRQEKLESGTNIKTINGQSILGSGNIEIQGGGSGGSQYYAGSGISIDNNTISLSANVFNEIYSKLGSGDTAFDSARLGGSAATEFAKTLDLNLKYDKTGGTVSGQVLALEDVLCYGASSVVPTGLSVINNLTSTSTTNALSAKQGKVLNEKFSGKQDTLVSGTNIKTINGMSLLGSGNIEIQGGGGGQTIYYTGGTNIKIEDFVISVSGAVQSAVTAVSATTSNDSAKLGGSAATEFVKLSQMNDALDLKYDKTGGTVNGSIHATGTVSADGDVMSYGASSVVPQGLSVINSLTSTSQTNALSANMGRTLSGMVNTKQVKLVSGTNIKTINGQSLLGSGNIEIQGGGGGTQYYEGSGISIANSTISVSAPLFAEIYGKANSAGTYTGLTVGSAASATTAKSAATAGDSAKLGGSAATDFAKTIDLDLKYDKTGGTITGNVQVSGTIEATKDIMTYGASNVTPTGITVIQDLIHSANTLNNVLAARQGYLLNKNKQDKLVSGTNIKTINGNSLLGSGNIVIEGGGGASYSPGTNISISNGTISVTGRVESASTCLTAATATTAENATYASRLGTSSAYHTKSSIDTALSGKLGTGDTASNSTKWGGYNIVVGSTGTAANTIYFGY